MQRTLLLHFLKFAIQSADLDLGDWIDRLYTPNDLTARFPGRAATVRLHIERLGAPGVATITVPPTATFAETNLCGAPCYYAAGRFYAVRDGAPRHAIAYDLHTGTIQAQVGGEFLESGLQVIIELLRPLLQSFILPFYGIKTLHGAVLRHPERTIALDGPDGAGKTTTAIMLAHAGYDLVSDDGPFFIMDGDHAFALSSLDFARVTGQTVRLFPRLAGLVVGPEDRWGKHAISLRDLQARPCTEPLSVTHYIRLRRSRGATLRLRTLSRGDLYRDMAAGAMVIFRAPPFRQAPYPFRAYSQFILDLISRLVRDVEAYDLEFADHHLAGIPALLEQL